MRRFYLMRHEDRSGVSGLGVVAEGIQMSNGKCVLSWLTELTSTGVYDDVETLIAVHGHGGATELRWLDFEIEEIVD